MAKDSLRVRNSLSFKPQTVAPTDPTNGDEYYDKVLGYRRIWINGTWYPVLNQIEVSKYFTTDTTGWDGVATQVTYITSASIPDARYAMWAFYDVANNYEEIPGVDFEKTETSVTAKIGIALPAGTYVVVGIYVAPSQFTVDDFWEWDGFTDEVTYLTYDKMADARQSIWRVYDSENNYEEIDGAAVAKEATRVTVRMDVPPPPGTYTIVGIKRTHNTFVEEDSTNWDGLVTQVTYDVNPDAQQGVPDARQAIWTLLDNANNYEEVQDALFEKTASQVTVKVPAPLAAGTYTVMGIY